MKKNVQRLTMLAVTVMASMATFAQSGETTTLKPLTEPLGDYYMTRYHVTNANSSPGQIEQIGFASNVNSDATQMTDEFDGTLTIFNFISGSVSAWVSNIPANAYTSTTLNNDTPNKSDFAACAALTTKLSFEYDEERALGPATIGSKAFAGLTALTEVINQTPGAKVATIPDNAFDANVYKTASLIVPDGSMGKYNQKAGWKNFYKIVTESGTILGDYNGNGEVKQNDAMLFQRALKTTEASILEPYNEAADFNSDGKVTQADYVLFVRKLKSQE